MYECKSRLKLGLKSCLSLKLFRRKIFQLDGKILTSTEKYKNWPKQKEMSKIFQNLTDASYLHVL